MATCRWEDWPPGTTSFAVGTGVVCGKPACWRQRDCGGVMLCDEHFNGTVAWWRERNYDLAADYEPIPVVLPTPVSTAVDVATPPDIVMPEALFTTRLRRRRLWGLASGAYCEVVDVLIVCEACNATIVDGSSQGDELLSMLRVTERGRTDLEAQIAHYGVCAARPVT